MTLTRALQVFSLRKLEHSAQCTVDGLGPQRSTVRVKGGMSLRNGMWHGLRNDIIMRNLIYADHFQRNKLN